MLKNTIIFIVAIALGYFIGATRGKNSYFPTTEGDFSVSQRQNFTEQAAGSLTVNTAHNINALTMNQKPTLPSWENALNAALEEKHEGVKKYQALLNIASLPVADQIALLHNLKAKPKTPENIQLLKNIAYLLASEHPDNALALLEGLLQDEKAVLGAGIVFGVASAHPEKAWEWAEKNIPYNKSTSFLTKNEFNSFLSLTLGTLAKDPENQWHAYELAGNIDSGGLNKNRWIKFSVARVIAENSTDVAIARILEEQSYGVSNPELVSGVVAVLSKRDLNQTAQFIIENQNIIPENVVRELSASYINDGRLDEYHQLIASVDNEDLYQSMVTSAARSFPEVSMEDTVRLVQSIDDQELKSSAIRTASIHMEDLPYSFEDHMHFFDEALENISERYDNYSFASTLHEWSKKNPEEVKEYIDNLPNDEQNSIELFYDNLRYIVNAEKED